MKSAFKAAFLTFVKQCKENHLEYCKSVVAKNEKTQPKKVPNK